MRTVTTETGERMVMLSLEEYETLVDVAESARTMREFANGRMEFLADDEMDAYLAAPTPLAFWRKRRGVDAADLAVAARITPELLAKLESGAAVGDVATYRRLARRLRISLDSIVPVEPALETNATQAAE